MELDSGISKLHGMPWLGAGKRGVQFEVSVRGVS